MTQPLIITAAVNGAETTRDQNPHVPYTADEIADEAVRCRQAGASMVHVHGRLDDGTPSQSRPVFGAILDQIRQRSDILVQFSTGGAVDMSVDERIEALDLRPDMATLTTGTVNFGDDVFVNSVPMIRRIADRLADFDIRPEIEVFDTGMVDTALRLVDEDLLDAPLHFDFVLGVPGAMGGRAKNLEFLVDMIPDESTWTVAGVGRHELPLAYQAIDMGGHVRVGLEDNVFVEQGVPARGTWDLVDQVVDYANTHDRDLADPRRAADLLRL